MTVAGVVSVGRPVIVSKAMQVVKLGESPRGVQLGDAPPLAIEVPPEKPAANPPAEPQDTNKPPAAFAPEPKVEAPPRSSTFTCTVDKTGQPLGIRVEYVRDKCIVLALTSGAIPAWNSANPDKAIRTGDRIREVNGESVSAVQLADKLAHSTGKVELLVERPQELRLPIKAGEVLGIKVAELLEGFGLEVSEVKDNGQIPSFNKGQSVTVRPSDRIVAVNGNGGSSAELFEMVAGSCQELLIYTYS